VSTLPPSSAPDDPLARAEAAFLRTHVPDGPAPDVIARTLAALRTQTEQQTSPLMRRKTVLATIKIAATVLVAASGVAYFALPPSTEATAFAVMAQKLREAHSLAYTSTTESADIKPPVTMKFLFKEPNLFRTEVPGGIITIINSSQGKQLILDPAAKTALLLEGKPPAAPAGPGAGVGLVGRLRQLTQGDAKLVGEKAIGAIQARGYLVSKFGMEMTIWIDPGTRLPIRLELSDRIQGKEIRVTASDFQIDPDFDDALFRTDPPAGYALRKAESDALGMGDKTFLNLEKAAEGLLRNFAARTGGTFPKRIDDFNEFDKEFPKKVGVLPDAEMFRAVQSLIRFTLATRNLKGGFGYKSDGVKLGDADKILFWYRPEGAAHYRAIYGDLHAADVTEDKLPEKPQP
jgi:outer membrane lipoprotein-sorting protein